MHLFSPVFAQRSSAPTVGGVSATISTAIGIGVCCACCCTYLRRRNPKYSRPVTHANRTPRPTPHTSTVIRDQNCQVCVATPSRGIAPPYASTAGRPVVPIYTPVAPQYKLSGYSAAEAPPPYSSLPPPYHAVQSELVQHSQVHNLVESEAEAQAEPVLHAASDSEVHRPQNEVEAQPVLCATSNSEPHNVVESVGEEQTNHTTSFLETPYAENQELQPTSTPRPGMETQAVQIDFQVDSDDEESSVVANPYTG